MKKLLFICFVFMGLALQAQPGPDAKMKYRKEMKEKMDNLTPQERATLKAKEMTLHLDLNEKQQKQVEILLLQQEEKREALREKRKEGEELTKEEKFALKSKMLDEQIAFKKEMKNILNEEQYAKFEKAQHHKGRMKKHPGKQKEE
ncbi:MAG: hypothetical protein R2776_00285 [Flavobacteriaceae bacterium]|nr:hypothetical protein [Flavobacteriaceae bacterium]